MCSASRGRASPNASTVPSTSFGNRSAPISVGQATILSDLARRVPLVHSAGSTFNGSPGDGSAHGLLTDFAEHAGHPADWVFVPSAPDGRSPDAWPIGAHEGDDTAGVHYARVALVPEPRFSQRRAQQWLNYADDLDAMELRRRPDGSTPANPPTPQSLGSTSFPSSKPSKSSSGPTTPTTSTTGAPAPPIPSAFRPFPPGTA